jgi:hypothetical protein
MKVRVLRTGVKALLLLGMLGMLGKLKNTQLLYLPFPTQNNLILWASESFFEVVDSTPTVDLR